MNERNIIINQGTNDDYLVICDHASNRIPNKYDNLGLNKEKNGEMVLDLRSKSKIDKRCKQNISQKKAAGIRKRTKKKK